MRRGPWKSIRARQPELYILEADPGEQTNVIADHPGVAEELRALLDKLVESPDGIRGAGGA